MPHGNDIEMKKSPEEQMPTEGVTWYHKFKVLMHMKQTVHDDHAAI